MHIIEIYYHIHIQSGNIENCSYLNRDFNSLRRRRLSFNIPTIHTVNNSIYGTLRIFNSVYFTISIVSPWHYTQWFWSITKRPWDPTHKASAILGNIYNIKNYQNHPHTYYGNENLVFSPDNDSDCKSWTRHFLWINFKQHSWFGREHY